MEISLDMVTQMSPEMARQLIPQWLLNFVIVDEPGTKELIERVSKALERFEDQEITDSLYALAHVGDEYQLYPADPVARDVSRGFMRVLTHDAQISGVDNLRDAMAAGPCLLLSNHLAYCDTQIKDVLLADAGASDLGEAIVAVAGPKVYGTVFRRMASVGLNTMKTAQSSNVAHNQAGLSLREVAVIALNTVRRAGEFMQAGRPILLYAEGSRSRDGRLQPFLRAVRKYAKVPGVRIVPIAISGSNEMMPISQPHMFPVPVQLRIGQAVDPESEGGVVEGISEVWRRIAFMLPEDNKPLPDTPTIA